MLGSLELFGALILKNPFPKDRLPAGCGFLMASRLGVTGLWTACVYDSKNKNKNTE